VPDHVSCLVCKRTRTPGCRRYCCDCARKTLEGKRVGTSADKTRRRGQKGHCRIDVSQHLDSIRHGHHCFTTAGWWYSGHGASWHRLTVVQWDLYSVHFQFSLLLFYELYIYKCMWVYTRCDLHRRLPDILVYGLDGKKNYQTNKRTRHNRLRLTMRVLSTIYASTRLPDKTNPVAVLRTTLAFFFSTNTFLLLSESLHTANRCVLYTLSVRVFYVPRTPSSLHSESRKVYPRMSFCVHY